MAQDELIGKVIKGYEILRQIGQGGMATVYLANQQSMNRQVALKVLPKHLMGDDTYLQRFEREVKIVSTLEHRNIVPVYDYGELEGQPYIVMRYMSGGSIDDLLQHGALDVDVIGDIITQIAPALDYAHSKNVLHRDLKPSNVLLDDDGGAFITDFGIARILGEQGTAITTQGVVGTPSYMSPEQAQAHPMDGRSDVYSLGVMLFEMATGRRPFESDTPYSIAVMQVTKPPPSPRKLYPTLTAAMESVILKSLKKNPDDRYPSAISMAEALKLAIERPDSIHDTQPNLKRTDDFKQPASQTMVTPPPSQPAPQLQPVQPVNVSPHQPIPGVPASGNYYSSIQQPKVKRRKFPPWMNVVIGGGLGCGLLAIIGGVVLLVIGAMNNPSNVIVVEGTDEPSTTEVIADTAPTNAPRTEIAVTPSSTLDLTSDAARNVLLTRSANSDLTLTAVARQTEAAPTRDVRIDPIGSRGTPTLAPGLEDVSGEIIYFDQRGDNGAFEIMRLRLDDFVETQLTLDGSDNTYPAVSPDGRWVAFQSDRDGDFEIYVMNLVGGQVTQITRNDWWDRLPSWSPDGQWVIYSSDIRQDETFDLYKARPDGTDEQLVFSNGGRNSHVNYSPDGKSIVFTSGSDPLDSRTWEILRYDLETQEVTQLTENEWRDASPSFSPDGETILYVTFRENDNAIAMMDADGGNRRIVYDGEGNEWAASFSPDGRFIVFTTVVEGEDELYLMTANGRDVQRITFTGGAFASWIPGR